MCECVYACIALKLPTVTRSQATVWIAYFQNVKTGGEATSAEWEQAREQAQVHVGVPGSKGPVGRSSVLLAHKDNISEGGYDDRMGLGWAGVFTGTGDSGFQRTSQSCVCVMVVWVVWAVRACVEWLAWMETVGGVDDRQNCDREEGSGSGWMAASFF